MLWTRTVLVGVFFIFVLTAVSGSAAADTLVVDNDTSECPGANYKSIQNAVDNASSGDTIDVCASTYNESVNISTSDIILLGAPGNATPGANTTAAPTLDSGKANASAVNLSAGLSNVTINGFEIKNYTDSGVRGVGSPVSKITLRNLTIHEMSIDILVGDEAGDIYENWTIVDSHLSNPGGGNHGIVISPRNNSRVRDLTVQNTNFTGDTTGHFWVDIQYDFGEGEAANITLSNITLEESYFDDGGSIDIDLYGLSDTTMHDFTIKDNNLSDTDYIIIPAIDGNIDGVTIQNNSALTSYPYQLLPDDNAVLSNVTVTENRFEGTSDIYSSGSGSTLRDVSIHSNEFSESAASGIVINTGPGKMSNVSIAKNNITNNDNWGILLQHNGDGGDLDSIDIARNNISGNGGPSSLSGIKFRNSDSFKDVKIVNNTLSNNDQKGIFFESNSAIGTLSVSNNTITDNSEGVNITSTDNVSVRDTAIRDNDDNGLIVASTDNITVTNTTIENNSGEGIDVTGAENISIRNSTVTNNDKRGVYIRSNANETDVTNNSISENNRGIYVDSSYNVTISENTVSGPNFEGIALDGAADAVIRNNTVSDVTNTGYAGIALYTGNRTTVSQNTLFDNVDGIQLFSESWNNTIAENNVSLNSGIGIRASNSDNNVFRNNTVLDNVDDGFSFFSLSNATVQNNTMRNNSVGVDISDATELSISNNTLQANTNGSNIANTAGPVNITDNDLTDNDHSAVVIEQDAWAASISIHNNLITNNAEYGVYSANTSEIVNATNNDWDSGPSSPRETTLEDPVTAALADGSGDAVSENASNPGVSNIHFDPYIANEDESGDGGSTSSGTGGGAADEPAAPKLGIPPDAVVAQDIQQFTDADPSRTGLQIRFDSTKTTEELTFADEDMDQAGRIEVSEAERLSDDVSAPRGTVRAVIDIAVPATIADKAATIRFRLDARTVEDPTAIVLQRYLDATDTWTVLDTRVVGVDEAVVRFEAETPGFSLFTVTTIHSESTQEEESTSTQPSTTTSAPESTADQTVTRESESESTPPTTRSPGLNGFGLVITLITLLGSAHVAVGTRTQGR